MQGWRVPGDELTVEIPSKLLTFLEAGTGLDAQLRATVFGTYRLTGTLVTEPEVLAQMDMPGHEAAVEVGKLREDGTHERTTDG